MALCYRHTVLLFLTLTRMGQLTNEKIYICMYDIRQQIKDLVLFPLPQLGNIKYKMFIAN